MVQYAAEELDEIIQKLDSLLIKGFLKYNKLFADYKEKSKKEGFALEAYTQEKRKPYERKVEIFQ